MRAAVPPPPRILPAFGRGCLADVVPTALSGVATAELPIDLTGPAPIVLLVLDGLGWELLGRRADLAPTLASLEGSSITSVAPSTTATALTSITTGLPPGEHGIVGYRMVVHGEVMNTLRWAGRSGDMRRSAPPEDLQPHEPFLGRPVDHVTNAAFATTGLTRAHLRGSRARGYRTLGVLVHQAAAAVREGASFVYAYYDGVDKVAHEFGLGAELDAELRIVDALVAQLLDALPPGTQLAVTADHGLVDAPEQRPVAPEVAALTRGLSGEARFRWLHARPGAVDDLADAARSAHGDVAWVATLDEMVDERWFGPVVRHEVRSRLGDVALLPFVDIGFTDPDDGGPIPLVGRHGSLTADEMLVPLIGATT